MGSIVQNALFARNAAMEEGDAFRSGRAQLKAGSALAAGDPNSAANVLNQSGQIDAAQGVTTYAKKQADDTITRQGLSKYVNKDYAGAKVDMAAAGNLPGVQAAMTGEDNDKAEHLKFTIQASKALRQIADTQGIDHVIQAFDQLAPAFKGMGADDRQLQAYRQALGTDPRGFLDAVDAATEKEMADFTLKDGETRFHDGKQVASLAAKPKVYTVRNGDGSTSLVTLPEDQAPPAGAVAAPPGAQGPPMSPGGAAPAPARPAKGPGGPSILYTSKPKPSGPAEGEISGGLSPAALDYVAQQYIGTGQMPPLGYGKAAAKTRQAIIERASAIEAETGLTGQDAVVRHASTKAASQTLNKLTSLRGNVSSFEATAKANADLALSLAPKGAGPTGSPVLNRWIQAGRKQVAGDPDVSNFDIALGTFADEYAKISQGITGGGGSTEGARKEAYDRLSKYASQGQLAGGIATMKKEMANRINSLDAEIGSTKESIRSGGKKAEPKDDAAASKGWGKAVVVK